MKITIKLNKFSIFFDRNILQGTIVDQTDKWARGDTVLMVFLTRPLQQMSDEIKTFDNLFSPGLKNIFLKNDKLVDNFFMYSTKVAPFKMLRSKPIHVRGEQFFLVNNERKMFFKKCKIKLLPLY